MGTDEDWRNLGEDGDAVLEGLLVATDDVVVVWGERCGVERGDEDGLGLRRWVGDDVVGPLAEVGPRACCEELLDDLVSRI